MAQRLPINRAIDFREGQNWLQLGGKGQPFFELCVIERLDAQAIAGEQQALETAVPDCKREHSPQVVDTTRPIFLIQVNDAFGVALRTEFVPISSQLSVKIPIVVNLAIEDDADRAVLIEHR